MNPTKHLGHRWADGWRCWLCSAWSERSLLGTCRVGQPISLSYVPLSRPCTLSQARSRREERA